MTLRLIPLLLAISTILSGCNSPRTAEKFIKTTVATGARAGYYKRVCEALRTAAQSHSLSIECVESSGSQDNVYRLTQQKSVDFALVQSDVAHHAWNGEYPFDEPQPGMRVVAPLFTERMHILVRPHQYLTSLTELREKKMWLGSKNSGSRFSAINLLVGAGMPVEEVVNNARAGLDAPKAFALLGAKHGDGSNPELDAVISNDVPNPRLFFEILGSLGIRTERMRRCQESSRPVLRRLAVKLDGNGQPLRPPGQEEFIVLLRPNVEFTGPSDFKGQKVWVERDLTKRVHSALETIGASFSNADDVAQAFGALRRGELDAMLVPDLTPEVLNQVLGTRGYKVLHLSDKGHSGGKKLMVFVRPNLTVVSATDLLGRKLWWDDTDNGVNAEISDAISHNTSWLPTPQPQSEITLPMAMDLLMAGELDAIFQTTVAPERNIATLLQKPSELTLLGVDWSMVEKLVSDDSYVQTSIQPSAYPDLRSGVYTVAVQTLLVTNQTDSSNETVSRMVEVLRDERQTIEDELSHATALDPRSPVEPFTLTLLDSPLKPQISPYVHEGAREFLVPPGHLRRGVATQIAIVISGSMVFLSVFLALRRKHKLSRRQTFVVLDLAVCQLVWFVGASLLQATDGDIAQEFATLVAAGRAIAWTVISHLYLPINPPIPTTRGGQLTMNIVSWMMTGLLGLVLTAIRGVLPPWIKSPWAEPAPATRPVESAAAAD